ncbi:MAG: hypothetical protein JST82_13860 [Bacteroidetes bacterium]|nr:hypothetical protein [Bacteroidota bacterium]
MKKVISSISLLITFLWCSCSSMTALAPDAYVRYMDDPANDLIRTIKLKTATYTIHLITPEYIASKEFSDGSDSIKNFEKRLRDLEGVIYFYINIQKNNTDNSVAAGMAEKSKAEQMVMYYEADAAKDIYLLNNNNQLSPAIYHYEDNYGLAAYNKIIVGFHVDTKNPDYKLVFNDRYNDNPQIQASYSSSTIKNLPQLTIK